MKKKNSFLKDMFEVVIAVAIISFLLLKFIVMPCEVNGDSMYPTLNDSDKVYSFIFTKSLGINRFDICVINTQLNGSERKIVKRVIGMPNETVEYKNNKLYINGNYIEENFLEDCKTEDLKIVLGENEYYCLGDNRQISRDSRFYGPFVEEDIIATHILVLYPFDNFGVKK